MSYFKETSLSGNSKTDNLDETVVRLVKENKPRSVDELIIMVKTGIDIDEKTILAHILKLRNEGIIKLEEQPVQSQVGPAYLRIGGLWYWLTIAAGALAVALVLTISQNLYPWAYLRNVFGAIFVLFLPGYAFVKALFPFYAPLARASEELEIIVQVGLSMGMSVALVSIVGLFLYYSPWGLNLTAVVLSLFGLTVFLATVALARKRNFDIEA